jgi:hypothetical protein
MGAGASNDGRSVTCPVLSTSQRMGGDIRVVVRRERNRAGESSRRRGGGSLGRIGSELERPARCSAAQQDGDRPASMRGWMGWAG